jgi:hypothetical protein
VAHCGGTSVLALVGYAGSYRFHDSMIFSTHRAAFFDFREVLPFAHTQFPEAQSAKNVVAANCAIKHMCLHHRVAYSVARPALGGQFVALCRELLLGLG